MKHRKSAENASDVGLLKGTIIFFANSSDLHKAGDVLVRSKRLPGPDLRGFAYIAPFLRVLSAQKAPGSEYSEKGWKSQQQPLSIFPFSLFTCTWDLICWETQSIFQWPFFRSMLHFQDFSHQLLYIRRSVHISDGRALSVVLMTLNWSQYTTERKREWTTTHHSRKAEKSWSNLECVGF